MQQKGDGTPTWHFARQAKSKSREIDFIDLLKLSSKTHQRCSTHAHALFPPTAEHEPPSEQSDGEADQAPRTMFLSQLRFLELRKTAAWPLAHLHLVNRSST